MLLSFIRYFRYGIISDTATKGSEISKTLILFCEVFSKEKLIRSLATSLNLSHDHCRSVKIQEIDKKRANCLGLDVSKIEKILGRRMPSLKETIVSIRNDFNRHELQHE